MDVLEQCNFVLENMIQGRKRPLKKEFNDVRDKYRIFYLTGRENFLDPNVHRSFNPVKVAKEAGKL